MKKFSEYLLIKGKFISKSKFYPAKSLPEYPITTPFTFPVYKNKIILIKDKNGWWNPVGGHIEEGETWKEALIRENYEEAGIKIALSSIKVYGYILVENIKGLKYSSYPKISILPITKSEVISIDYQNWKMRETLGRSVLSKTECIKLLEERGDNKQMLEIFLFLFFRSRMTK